MLPVGGKSQGGKEWENLSSDVERETSIRP